MAYLAPSILNADFSCLADQIALIEQGGADYLHLDVMDGTFVPNITFGGPVVQSLAGKTKLPFDVHLMIERPELRLADFVTPQTEYIVVHAEACTHLHRTLQQIKDLGCKAGVALNPATPLSNLYYLYDDLDLVLLMTVNPGFGGQSFIPACMEKIKRLKKNRDERGLNFMIEVDGGVSLKNAKELVDAGVDMLVAGSSVYGAADIPARCREFKSIIG